MSEDTKFVTIATFQDPVDANLAQTALESAGVESFLQGGNANSMIPSAFTARLLVRSEDEAAARSVVDGAVDTPESMETVTAAEIADEGEVR
ncbi:putative signal transducing protein [Granulicella mallensis]|jgi:hypothetical protein|uniref:DUF2007 domain-containing protein n=1 Tax=Granulicella mallensis TaxID=940614 RepID=A0A7W7ZTP5_9BACT|nr:DUF2007 domain-containing protein [Granulicella mallensis]MBB5065607.1 hypothetical protein [Granulicella mallensis]